MPPRIRDCLAERLDSALRGEFERLVRTRGARGGKGGPDIAHAQDPRPWVRYLLNPIPDLGRSSASCTIRCLVASVSRFPSIAGRTRHAWRVGGVGRVAHDIHARAPRLALRLDHSAASTRTASSTEVYESLGLMQIKWRPDGSLHPGTEPLRWKSTAFNADYHAAMVRFFYDGGARSWYGHGSSYGPGQAWNSVGAWYQPTPVDEPTAEHLHRQRESEAPGACLGAVAVQEAVADGTRAHRRRAHERARAFTGIGRRVVLRRALPAAGRGASCARAARSGCSARRCPRPPAAVAPGSNSAAGADSRCPTCS